MNIAKTMEELMAVLKKGNKLQGIRFPDIRKESEKMWHEHYAIVQGFRWDLGIDPPPYFDEDAFLLDLRDLVVNLFAENKNDAVIVRDGIKTTLAAEPAGTLIIHFHLSSGELEVFHKDLTKEFFDKLEQEED